MEEIKEENNNKEYYIENDYTYPLQETETNSILIKYVLDKNISETAGNIEIYLGDEIIHKEPIKVRDKITNPKKSIFAKIKEWFKKL